MRSAAGSKLRPAPRDLHSEGSQGWEDLRAVVWQQSCDYPLRWTSFSCGFASNLEPLSSGLSAEGSDRQKLRYQSNKVRKSFGVRLERKVASLTNPPGTRLNLSAQTTTYRLVWKLRSY